MTNKLPDKLSDLIDVALADLEACEADPRYVIDMDEWHYPNRRGHCAVCLAGSVMAQRLGASVDTWVTPEDFDHETCSSLSALNSLLCGDIFEAVSDRVGSGAAKGMNLPPDQEVVEYRFDPAQFKADMRRLAATLREHGL